MPLTFEAIEHDARSSAASGQEWYSECEPRSWRNVGERSARICVVSLRPAVIQSEVSCEPWESLAPALSGIGDAIVRSREMLTFPDDWDEDGARPIDPEAWNRAVKFLMEHAASAWKSEARVLDAPDITPCRDGSVDLHWDYPKYEILINFPVDPAQRAGFYGDDRGTLFIKGTFDPATLNQGLLDWLSKTR